MDMTSNNPRRVGALTRAAVDYAWRQLAARAGVSGDDPRGHGIREPAMGAGQPTDQAEHGERHDPRSRGMIPALDGSGKGPRAPRTLPPLPDLVSQLAQLVVAEPESSNVH